MNTPTVTLSIHRCPECNEPVYRLVFPTGPIVRAFTCSACPWTQWHIRNWTASKVRIKAKEDLILLDFAERSPD